MAWSPARNDDCTIRPDLSCFTEGGTNRAPAWFSVSPRGLCREAAKLGAGAEMAVPNRQLARTGTVRLQRGTLGGLIDLPGCIGVRIMEPELVVMAIVTSSNAERILPIRRIRAMERRGDDTTSSVEHLVTMKRSLALHESHRENILEALGRLGPTVHT